jgi:hypothetical protein
MNTDRQNNTDDSTEQLVMPVNFDIRHISAEQLAELGVAASRM